MAAVLSASHQSIDARIAHACATGHPVTTRRSLRAAGISRQAIARRIADGRLVEIWPGTFLVGIEAEDACADLIRMAAIATAGPGAALDGACALQHRGLWPRHDGAILVTSPRSLRPVPTFNVRFRRAPDEPDLRSTNFDGLPMRNARDALFVASEDLTAHQLAFVIRNGEYAEAFTLEELRSELARRHRQRGNGTMRRALALRSEGSAGTKSRSEDRLYPHLARAFGEPLVNVMGAARIPDYEPDFCWPERRWIVEVDGRHHDGDDQRRRDCERDAILRAAGWIIVRIPYRCAWDDLPGTLARIAAAFR